jgi:hypothetical protein
MDAVIFGPRSYLGHTFLTVLAGHSETLSTDLENRMRPSPSQILHLLHRLLKTMTMRSSNAFMMLKTLLISLFLLSELAFAQDCTADGLCDTHERCPVWKNEGECVRNRSYMDEHCPAQCIGNNVVLTKNECDDLHERCSVWAAAGECVANPDDMEKYCKKACNLCDTIPQKENAAVKQSTENQAVACNDEEDAEKCAFWAKHGECESNKGFMLARCAKSCGVCNDKQKAERSVLELFGVDSDVMDQVVEKSATFGVRQEVMGDRIVDILRKIEETMLYMNNEKTLQLPKNVLNNW